MSNKGFILFCARLLDKIFTFGKKIHFLCSHLIKFFVTLDKLGCISAIKMKYFRLSFCIVLA